MPDAEQKLESKDDAFDKRGVDATRVNTGLMANYPYINGLTPQERMEGARFGAMHKLATSDVLVKEGKINLDIELSLAGLFKAIGAVAVLTGVPFGIAAHMVNRKMTAQRVQERELQEKVKFFRTSGDALEQGLPPQQLPEETEA